EGFKGEYTNTTSSEQEAEAIGQESWAPRPTLGTVGGAPRLPAPPPTYIYLS
ncbi:hypothetical protein HAX54_009154, partial [Datura stramonium]|nr:hypothetical protein [Datura stramonium]